MKTQIRPIFSTFLILTIITGVIYPLLITGLAQVFFPSRANGSLVLKGRIPVGSKLIGQNFTSDSYFWGRPSSTSGTPYNALDLTSLTGSSGSNLGPLSQNLFENVQQRAILLRQASPSNQALIPVDLVTSSASGLDPHISVAAAYFQVPRVAISRGMREEELIALIDRTRENRQILIFGEPTVNVLLLNLTLDGIELNHEITP